MSEQLQSQRDGQTGHLEQDSHRARGRLMLGTFMLAGPITGLAMGNLAAQDSENADNAEYSKVAAGYERCIDVIEDQLKPGDTTITLKLSKTSKQLQEDCGINPPFSLKQTQEEEDPDSYDSHFFNASYGVKTKFKITEAEVTLPTIAAYEKEIATRQEKAEFSRGQVATETGGYGVLGLMIGVTAFTLIAEKQRRRLDSKGSKERFSE